MSSNKQKIQITIGSRANFGRLETLVDSLSQSESVFIRMLVHASALSERFCLSRPSLNKLNSLKLYKLQVLVCCDAFTGSAKTNSSSLNSISDLLINSKLSCIIAAVNKFQILVSSIASFMLHILVIYPKGEEVAGKSSSLTREGSFLGVPELLTGSRQKDRITGENIIISDNNACNKSAKASRLVEREKLTPSKLSGDRSTEKKIADIILSTKLSMTGL